jgi:hypothetical protein
LDLSLFLIVLSRKNIKKICAIGLLLSKITKQVKKSMPTYNEEFLENLLCLEGSEISDKTGKISPERRS